MNIESQFNLIAEEYDKNRRKFIPCYNGFYNDTTRFIASNIPQPKLILDLGAGTGLLSYFWYQQFPDSEYVLVDIADDMLNVARKRFESKDNISYQILNYSKALPHKDFDTIISALSIHHLEDENKSALFHRIFDKLPNGGFFINYDQFCAEQAEMREWYDKFWESQLYNSGLTAGDIELWKERRKLDRECSAEQEIEMLRKCGFKEVENVLSFQKFSVIIAVK